MENSYVYSEVLDILNNMEEKYIKMIPKNLMDFFKENKNQNYKKHINPNEALAKQNISKNAITILSIINLNYWVKDQNHKLELIKKYKNNNILENNYVEIKDIFQNNKLPNTELVCVSEQTKDNIFKRLINWLKGK